MKQITEDEQKRIFSKNLSYFLSIKQTSMPQVSTIQKIADYVNYPLSKANGLPASSTS